MLLLLHFCYVRHQEILTILSCVWAHMCVQVHINVCGYACRPEVGGESFSSLGLSKLTYSDSWATQRPDHPPVSLTPSTGIRGVC